jgi:hypothetical protein
MLFDVLHGVLPDAAQLLPERPDAAATERAAALLKEHKLDRVRTLTGNDGTVWRWRVSW